MVLGIVISLTLLALMLKYAFGKIRDRQADDGAVLQNLNEQDDNEGDDDSWSDSSSTIVAFDWLSQVKYSLLD